MAIVETIILAFYAYLFIGLIFSFWQVIRNDQKMDTDNPDIKASVRMMQIPATIALWPMILYRDIQK